MRGSPAAAAAGYAQSSLGQVCWVGASVGAAASVRARVATDCSSIPVPACLAPTTTSSQYLYYSTVRGAGQPSCGCGRGRQGHLSGDGALENTTRSAPAGPACPAPTNIPSQYTWRSIAAGAGQSSSGCGRLRRTALGPSQQLGRGIQESARLRRGWFKLAGCWASGPRPACVPQCPTPRLSNATPGQVASVWHTHTSAHTRRLSLTTVVFSGFVYPSDSCVRVCVRKPALSASAGLLWSSLRGLGCCNNPLCDSALFLSTSARLSWLSLRELAATQHLEAGHTPEHSVYCPGHTPIHPVYYIQSRRTPCDACDTTSQIASPPLVNMKGPRSKPASEARQRQNANGVIPCVRRSAVDSSRHCDVGGVRAQWQVLIKKKR